MLSNFIMKLFWALSVLRLCSATVTLRAVDLHGNDIKPDHEAVEWWADGDENKNYEIRPASIEEDMRHNVAKAYGEMKSQAEDAGLVPPSTMAVTYVPGHGAFYQSSGKGREQSDHGEIISTCRNIDHRYHGNCAEIWSIHLAREKGWPLQNAMIAVYGIKSTLTGVEGFMTPCATTKKGIGCAEVLRDAEVGLTCISNNDDADLRKRSTLHTAVRSLENLDEVSTEIDSNTEITKRNNARSKTGLSNGSKKKSKHSHKNGPGASALNAGSCKAGTQGVMKFIAKGAKAGESQPKHTSAKHSKDKGKKGGAARGKHGKNSTGKHTSKSKQAKTGTGKKTHAGAGKKTKAGVGKKAKAGTGKKSH